MPRPRAPRRKSSDQQRNFHRFARLSNSLVALSECDEQITGVARSVTRTRRAACISRRGENSYGNTNTDKTETEPDRRGQGPEAAGAVRRRAGVRENGTREHAPRLGVDGLAAAITDGKRRSDRQPSG